jgi:hypothetical protein
MITEVTFNGRIYEIPQMWIVGRMRVEERNGATPREAYLNAILAWVRQEELERIYKKEVRA